MSRRERTRRGIHPRSTIMAAHGGHWTRVSPMDIAMRRSQRLSAEHVAMQTAIVRSAIEGLPKGGLHAIDHWCSLADTANVATTLGTMGLGRGEDATRVIEQAVAALAAVWQRYQQRGTWAMHAEELDSLHWLAALHRTQLEACSYGELDDAVQRTAERLQQARAGNASPGETVLIGQLSRSH